MKIAVWIVSAVLALFFLFVGGTKVITPWEGLAGMGIPVILLKIAGFAEIVGALGLILPAATKILPILTPIAAAGLTLTMIGATIANIIIGQPAIAVQTLIAGLLAAFVAWARFSGRVDKPAAASDRNEATGEA